MKQSFTQFARTAFVSVVLCFLCILSASSQQFLTKINGMNAYVHLPDDYAATSLKYPVIIFITGLGEIGTDASKLLLYGPSQFISRGHKMEFMVDGQLEKPIVISLQSPAAWPRPELLKRTFDSVMFRYRGDADRLYLTGLSMGGWAHDSYIGFSQEYASRPAAIVAMSAPASLYSLSNYKWFAQAGGKWWGIEGNTDLRGNTKTRDTLNKYKAGCARYTQYTGGHCCWNTFYDPAWTEAGESIYTWMLKQRRGGALPKNIVPAASAGANVAVALPVDSVVLAGVGTDVDGSIAGYQWTRISGPSACTIVTPNQSRTIIKDHVAGSYTYELRVMDNRGALGRDTVSVTVSDDGALHKLPGKVEAENYNTMFGIMKAGALDAGGGSCVGYIAKDDWFEYKAYVSSAGNYTARFRVSSIYSNGQISLRRADGTVLSVINVPNTGANQLWTTVTTTVNLQAGDQTIRMLSNTSGLNGNSSWNINWFEFVRDTTATMSTTFSQAFRTKEEGVKENSTETALQGKGSFRTFPNPVASTFALELDNMYRGPMKVRVLDITGRVRKEFSLSKTQQLTQTRLSIGDLSAGAYFVTIQIGDWTDSKRILKL